MSELECLRSLPVLCRLCDDGVRDAMVLWHEETRGAGLDRAPLLADLIGFLDVTVLCSSNSAAISVSLCALLSVNLVNCRVLFGEGTAAWCLSRVDIMLKLLF